MKAYLKKSIFLAYLLLNLNNPLQSAPQMTQTEAHYSINKKLVDSWYNMESNPFFKKTYDTAVAREKQYNNTHYVFYNGTTNAWRAPQDLYLKLYTKLHPLTINIDNFRSFRWLPFDHRTPGKFIKDQMRKYGMVNDTIPAIKAFLLSTNLALFGNTGIPLECSFDYFLIAHSHTIVDDMIWKSILDLFDDPSTYKNGETPMLYKYIPRLNNLLKYLKSDKLVATINKKQKTLTPQSLAQIFIPKSFVDEVAYPAWVQGVPFEDAMVEWMKKDTHKKKGKKKKSVTQWLADIRELFKDKQKSHPMFKEILKDIESGEFSISRVLDEYKSTPQNVENLNFIQARLIISPEYIGNPSADVKVFMFDNISAANKQKYEKELDNIVNGIFTDVLNKAKKNIPAPINSTPKSAAGTSDTSV